ncbi:MAG TPA: DapH/DapD/GlmU-related protein [Bryobacteraceae bacterium]|jgi:maltose O-acetyltransferase|nr:DapH/DapD/GlmU-related protein [Bryobacteraceae bacterium]
MSRFVHLALYHALGRYLPHTTRPGGALSKRIRFQLCRPLFARCGQNANIGRNASIAFHAVSIGANSSIGPDSFIDSGTIIGDDVMMGRDVLIYTRNHAMAGTDVPMREQGYGPVAPVTIGDDVWIGARVIILPGVTIGSGSVLGAGAVVSKNVPPFAIVVGNPGVVIRYRDQPVGHSQPVATCSTVLSK